MSDDCIFCALVRGEVESSPVYQDTLTLAFMNLRQANPGHVLVIPKTHVETLDQLDPHTASALFQTVVKVAQAVQTAFQPEGYNIWQSNHAAAGQEISHVHIHVFPRASGDQQLQFYRNNSPEPAERAYLNALAAQIRGAFG